MNFGTRMALFGGLKKAQNLPSGTTFVLPTAALRLRLRKRQAGRVPVSDNSTGRTSMLRKMSLAIAATLMMAGAAYADPIEGNWKTEAGSTAAITPCGGGFCITLKDGKHAGKKIGTFNANGGTYAGKITDPANDKTYTGKASVAGSTLKMSGCVLGGLICKTQNWKKL
jgi:uncharacterized protein (DUF2147 family)